MTLVGSKILHYRILSEIGAGGMGVVYLAEDEKLHRQVALKFVAKSIQTDADARGRLIREARAASALNHPNIVSIHAIEETPEHIFIVMEYVQGDSLHTLVKRREMTWQRALELAPQILSALAAAHERGVVHRDIKSDNVILTAKGQAKVLDFGLARGRDAAAHVTRAGSSAGTPAYMSPEQIQGDDVDQRSDLFSFGVAFYEMLTGRMPFKGEHEAALTYSIVNETPTEIRTYNNAVPAALQTVVTKLLQKNPRDRYQSANEVLEDLRRVEAGRRVPGPRRNRYALVAGAGALVVVAAVVGWALHSRSPDAAAVAGADTRKMLAVLPFENLGPAEREYFTDGTTEEIRLQLGKLSGLGVISRTSAMQFKGSQKSLREIGKELGVDYALEGSVRWDKSGDQDNVRVSTQLIRINDETQLQAWTFDRVYDERILTLQSEIAQKVAEELNVTLLEPERAALAERSTNNLDAYDLYLRGREQYETATKREDLDAALPLIERAVRLDSTFTQAQAYLARVYANQYFNDWHPELPRLKQARESAEIALRHAPGQPQGHIALGYYHYYGSRDYDRALEEFAVAEKMQPNNADLFEAIAYVQRRQGKWDDSVKNLERAIDIDPKTTDRILTLTQTYMYMRRWNEMERCIERGLAGAKNGSQFTFYRGLMLMLRDGDVAGAQAVIEPLTAQIPQMNSVLTELDIMKRDYASVHRRFNRLGAFAGQDTTEYYAKRATAYHFAGDEDRADVFFDSLRVYLEDEKRVKVTDNAQTVMSYALTLAALRDTKEAVRYADKAIEMLPLQRDAIVGADLLSSQMILHIILHDYDRAIREIEYLLSIPSTMNPALLRLHPGFDPLRENPRFKRLAEQKVSS
jgi:eukaryotic-like serine/threonine-protein kinase